MPIELFTGQPGNGKTALMMERLLKEAKEGSRPLFAAGIDGLQPGLATVLEDPRTWNDLDQNGERIVPDGALIFVDEAWKWFGHLHDATRQSTPKHVLDLAEHRHRGLDFVWTIQQPNQLYPFVRGLIGSHAHVVRRFGTKFIDVFRWGELQEDVKSSGKRELAQRTTRMLPSGSFGSYKSAEVHTIKARLPLKLMLLPVIVAAGVFLAWSGWSRLTKDGPAPATGTAGGQSAVADAPRLSGSAASSREEPRWRSTVEYAKDHLPRIATMPWTAPIFDERQVRSDPLLVCMSSADGLDGNGERVKGSCTCVTEQSTAYDISEPECRTLARYGPVYNPYREQGIRQAQAQPQMQPQGQWQGQPQGQGAQLNGSILQRQTRALGSFPESPIYETESKTRPTTRDL